MSEKSNTGLKAQPTITPAPTATPKPSATPTATPKPSATPTATPAPTATPSGSYGSFTAVPITSTPKPTYGYYEYLPPSYNADTSKKWPLIIFLHGSGETGNSGTELSKILNTGLPEIIKNGKFPKPDDFIVISPQTWGYFTPSYMREFLNFLKARYRVDTTKMYLTGLSYGAFAIWDYVNTYGATTEFAAVVPISGNGNSSDGCQFKVTPLWAFHGAKDANAPTAPSAEIDPVNKINQCTPDEKAKITIYVNGTHGESTWNVTYDNSGMSQPVDSKYDPFAEDIYTWMLRHSKR